MSRDAWMYLTIITIIAGGAAWVASSQPDGLERVQTDLGVDDRAVTHFEAPLPDYEVPGVSGPWSGTAAGLFGTALVGGLAWAAGRVLVRRAA